MANYTKATNFLAKDSLATGDPAKIIKGSEFDTEFNALQTAVNSKANTISPAFTGTPTAPTASSATNTTQLATTEYVTSAVTIAMPSGGIIIWSGSAAAIPTGWYLCNGSNSTPDLRNRFIVGAGSTYAVGATGGSADAVVVSHTHTATVTDPGHLHTSTRAFDGIDLGSTSRGYDVMSRDSGFPSSSVTTATATTGVTVANSTTGVSGTNANLPPYYALCYIMKS
jgi:hypothetical protein